jgi:tetratricopeptide (TPR) repeat protein
VIPYLIVIAVFKLELFIDPVPAVQGSGVSGGWRGGSILPLFEGLAYFIRSLSFPYPQSVIIKEFGSITLSIVSLALAAGATVSSYRLLPGKRLVIFSSVFFMVAASPYLLVPFVEGIPAVTAERYTYAASIGFSLFAALVLAGVIRKKVPLLASVALILALYSVLSIANFYSAWGSNEAFWENVIRRNPDHAIGYTSLSDLENKAGRKERARVLLDVALSRPNGSPQEFSNAAFGLGVIAFQVNDMAAAEGYFKKSLTYVNNQMTHIKLGIIYLRTGEYLKAKGSFERAVRFKTRNNHALYGLAKSYSFLGDKDMARRYASEVLKGNINERLRILASELLK